MSREPNKSIGHESGTSTTRPPLDLLIRDELLRPCMRALDVLGHIKVESVKDDIGPALRSGAFAFAASQAEIAITDTARYILRRNPWRMDFAELPLKRADLIGQEELRAVLEVHADRTARRWAAAGMKVLLERFARVAGLHSAFFQDLSSELEALRTARNEILHQPRPDEWLSGNPLWIDAEALARCIETTSRFLSRARDALADRYVGYTRVAAFRRVWSYLFQSPVMAFEDFWHFDEERDEVFALNTEGPTSLLSTSEQTLLGLWRAVFTGRPQPDLAFSISALDSDRRRDLLTLLAVLRHAPWRG